MRKVFIVGRDFTIANMFLRRGWELVDNIDEDVLIQFTGGEDVDPSYYKETKHPRTYSNPRRDASEALIYNQWVGKVSMAGICRGAQFLNVMNGGSMWQHVGDHAISTTHEAHCFVNDRSYQVTSTHHQMMRAGPDAELLLEAAVASFKETADDMIKGDGGDVEALFYPKTRSLCFQPHPEYVSINHECQDLYFDYINQFLE